MAQWKVRGRSRTKEATYQEVEIMEKEHREPEEKIPDIRQKPQEKPLTIYEETLYSKDSVVKQKDTTSKEKKKPVKRTSWESVSTIEKTVDAMEETPMSSRGRETGCGSKVLEKTVDRVLLKKKVKP